MGANRRWLRFVEAASTKWLGLSVALTLVVVVGLYAAVVSLGFTTVDKLAKFTDAVIKAFAALIGTLWATNRYFIERTDAPQFRVDCDVSLIRWGVDSEPALLIFRLDLVNTGKTQIAQFNHFIEIDVARPTNNDVELNQLYRWPADGWHEGGPIEPGSWSAVNDEVRCLASVRAVRMLLVVALEQGAQWTWHKTFNVSKDET